MPDAITRLAAAVRQAAHPLVDTAEDYDSLLELIGDARFVLLGEASHGTHEFYWHRAQITSGDLSHRLIGKAHHGAWEIGEEMDARPLP